MTRRAASLAVDPSGINASRADASATLASPLGAPGARAPVARAPVARAPVGGASVAGAPVAGASVIGAPGAGAPGAGASVIGTPRPGRFQGERGAGLVVGLVLIFAFTFLGLVWLARDVDRAVSNRSVAQSVAFQAARSGAQSASIVDLRGADSIISVDTIDEAQARNAAVRTADALFASYGVDGSVTSIVVSLDSVSVTTSILESGVTVTGSATVRAERAP